MSEHPCGGSRLELPSQLNYPGQMTLGLRFPIHNVWIIINLPICAQLKDEIQLKDLLLRSEKISTYTRGL